MKTLEEIKPKAKNSRGLNTVEDAIASWYKPPKLKSILTEELAKQIAECYLDGCNDEDTACLCDVSIDSLSNWKNLPIIRKHEKSRKLFYIHEVRDGKRRDWTRLAWWLERRYPLEFSRPEVAHAISTSIHTTVNTTQNLIVSSELAEQLAERNAKIGAKIEQLFANRSSNVQVVNPSLGDGCLDKAYTSDAHKVRDVVASITDSNDVTSSPNDDMSSLPNPPSEHPAPGTPLVGAGAPTDSLSPTPRQKTDRKIEKGFEVITDIIGESEKSAAETRKNFDINTKKIVVEKELKRGPYVSKKKDLSELLDGVKKELVREKLTGEVRARHRDAMAKEIARRQKETRGIDRAKLRAANREADRLHPRKPHQ